MRAGLSVLAGAFDREAGPVGGGSHNPRGRASPRSSAWASCRPTADAVWPAAITARLARHALDTGVLTVFCSAQDDAVAPGLRVGRVPACGHRLRRRGRLRRARATATAVVLCGGDSRRLGGGSDKTAATLGATTVLDHLLDGLPADWPVVAVGPERPTRRRVRWTRETPAGGGPVAAVAAGLALVDTELVVVLAGDMPFAAGAATHLAGTLAASLNDDPTTDAVVAVDPGGRENPLLAAYRVTALRDALPHPPANAPARSLLAFPHLTEPVDEDDSSTSTPRPPWRRPAGQPAAALRRAEASADELETTPADGHAR